VGYTDAAGVYSLTDVATGNYSVAAVKEFTPTEAPFPVYMSGASEAYFCNGEDPVSIPTLILTEIPVEKPAIYLYPEQTDEISVTLDFAAGSRLTTSEPPYGDGWRVNVAPSGRIDDRYDYLFYEAAARGAPVLNAGWCFARSDLIAGLTQVVSQAGLSAAESADFLEYWLARLPDFAHYLVLPVMGDDLDVWVDLQVEPAPTSELRFWLFFQGSGQAVALEAPSIAPFVREGFTVVEWGGAVLAPRLR
jgi:internalin A